MIGIMLAGGLATRLPNKPLLPTKDGSPVCLSGLDYLKRHNVSHTVIVVPPNSPLVDVIEHFRPGQKYSYVYQPEAKGVGDAINLVKASVRAMIVVADNVYPEAEVVNEVECVVIRRVPAWRRPHLVGADGQRLDRGGSSFMPFSLTTPWVVGPGKSWDPDGWPSLAGIKQVEREADGWWDIGTPELYAAYWRQQ